MHNTDYTSGKSRFPVMKKQGRWEGWTGLMSGRTHGSVHGHLPNLGGDPSEMLLRNSCTKLLAIKLLKASCGMKRRPEKLIC